MEEIGPRRIGARRKFYYVDLDPPLIGVLDWILTRGNLINNLSDGAIFMKFNFGLVQSFNWSFARKGFVKESIMLGWKILWQFFWRGGGSKM